MPMHLCSKCSRARTCSRCTILYLVEVVYYMYTYMMMYIIVLVKVLGVTLNIFLYENFR